MGLCSAIYTHLERAGAGADRLSGVDDVQRDVVDAQVDVGEGPRDAHEALLGVDAERLVDVVVGVLRRLQLAAARVYRPACRPVQLSQSTVTGFA